MSSSGLVMQPAYHSKASSLWSWGASSSAIKSASALTLTASLSARSSRVHTCSVGVVEIKTPNDPQPD